jgi:hypothetical protein
MNNHLNFTPGELTIYIGADARRNRDESLRQAGAICRDKQSGKVLYINTSFSTRKMAAASRKLITDSEAASGKMLYYQVPLGELSWSWYEIKEMVKQHDIEHIIINSWEYGHKNYKSKEEIIFKLMPLMNAGVSLLIYSQANPETAFAGKIQRGGLGKLSGLADQIFKFKEPEEEAQKPALTATKNTEAPKKNEKLDARKINELEYARSEMNVASGGELLSEEEEERSEVMEEENLISV